MPLFVYYYFCIAGAIVTLSKKWKLVPKQEKCTISHSKLYLNYIYFIKYIPAKDSITLELNAENCYGIKSLEHVVSPIGVSLGARGDLRSLLNNFNCQIYWSNLWVLFMLRKFLPIKFIGTFDKLDKSLIQKSVAIIFNREKSSIHL
jgi:hypothetical protein